MAQWVKTGRAEVESLGGGEGIELAVVEGGQDCLDIERRDTVRYTGVQLLIIEQQQLLDLSVANFLL